MKAITLTQLHYVVEVARTGHFGRAAAACHVTQPTLSMQIHKLEEELGVLLFDRSRKPIVPTPMGHKIVALAKSALQEVSRIEEVIQGERGELRGEFSLAVIPTLAPYLLPRFLLSFSEKYPEVQLTVEELQTGEILKRLRENRLDVGLVALPLGAKGIVEQPIFREPFVGYLSPDHPLQSQSTLSERQLTGEDLWLLQEGHCFREQVLELCKNKRLRGSGGPVRFESGNLETLKRLVDRKQGYTLLPYLAVLDLPAREKEKKVRPFRDPVPAREVGLVHGESFVKFALRDALSRAIEEAVPADLRRSSKGPRVRTLPIRSFT